MRVLAVAAMWMIVVWAGGCASPHSPEVREALIIAGDNRGELEAVLEHYRDGDDPQKLQAAEFLIANMPGHGYAPAALYDAERNEIAYDALDYESFNEALAAIEALEDEHGEIDFKRKRFDEDVRVVTADYLIENIDLAFSAWREKPWARDLTFRAFCEHVLPYRGSNEPVEPWRKACMERYADLPARLDDPADRQEAASLIQRDVHAWVRFSDLYYLHPTDQGFAEMNERGVGRCEDITNMMAYAMRANAIACASDYTPWWADRDNNHAWEVILDEQGRGRAGLSNRAAKVYRKTYSAQRGNLAFRKAGDEKVPRWLSGRNYRDVTAQYLETTDVTIELAGEPPAGTRFAYLCVFNGGEWKAIHWGAIGEGRVMFTDMGRNIAYLPAYYVDDELVPAAAPFILTEAGDIRTLQPDSGSALTVQIIATNPTMPDADTRSDRPMIRVQAGRTYELFVWEGEWRSLGARTAGEEAVAFDSVPGGGLFWLVEEDSRRLERIFTFQNGRQVWW